jgi:PD-(D/E)XK endonuclease
MRSTMKEIRLARELLRNGKKRGEWAELVFAARAIARGFWLWRPWGESRGYDWVVEREGGGFARVQVKSTIFPEGKGYSCSLKDSKGVYRKKTFDFVAAYVIPMDVWYILPERRVRGMWSVGLHPELEKSKYGEFEEGWELLRGKEEGANIL